MKKIIMIFVMLQLLTTSALADEVLKIGVFQEKPILYMESSGAPGGFAIDILKDIEETEGYSFEYVPGTFSECLEWLKNGEIDVLPNLGYTEERAKQVKYSDEYFIENWGTVIVNENVTVKNVSDLGGLKIAIVKGYNSSRIFQDYAKNNNINVSFVVVETLNELFNMIEFGVVDGAVVNRFIAKEQEQNYNFKETSINFNPTKIKIGFKSQIDEKVIKQFDKHIKSIKNDPNSIFYISINKWFNASEDSNKELFMRIVLILSFLYILGTLIHYNFVKINKELQVSKKELFSEKDKLVQSNEKIHEIETNDQLTKLPNKNALKQDLKIACKKGTPFLIAYIDLDNLNKVNNTLGDESGDKLLLEFVSKLKKNIGVKTNIYRYEGDEFVLTSTDEKLLDDIDNNTKKLLKSLEESIEIGGINFVNTISVGISLFPEDTTNPEQLIKNAKIAVGYVKHHGKNNYKIHSEDMAENIMKKTILESQLRKAIENDEFEVYYQPKVDVNTEKIIGMEALARWKNGDGEIVPPINFIPLAEELSLINLIDELILVKACRQTNIWNEKGYKINVAVNLSAQQFENENLIQMVKSTLNQTGLSSKNLELEITESAVMENVKTSIDLIEKIRSLNIKVSLDDFGTGYSSLNYLRKLPIDILKIDKSSLDLILEDKKERIITEAIISLAHNMNLKIVAEGVESKEQLEFLKQQKCHEFQGYYFSKPVPASEFEKLLGENYK